MIDINLLDVFGVFQDRFRGNREVMHTAPPMDNPMATYRYLEQVRAQAAAVR